MMAISKLCSLKFDISYSLIAFYLFIIYYRTNPKPMTSTCVALTNHPPLLLQVCKITPYSSCNYRQTTDRTTDITGDIRLLRPQIVAAKMQVLYSHTVLWSHLVSGSASIILYCICSCVYSCIYSCKSHLITKCDRSHAVTVLRCYGVTLGKYTMQDVTW